jgi:DNA-binding LacI/PurR family transcriptional regulator
MATMKDVAKAAGVNTATVSATLSSLVLNAVKKFCEKRVGDI